MTEGIIHKRRHLLQGINTKIDFDVIVLGSNLLAAQLVLEAANRGLRAILLADDDFFESFESEVFGILSSDEFLDELVIDKFEKLDKTLGRLKSTNRDQVKLLQAHRSTNEFGFVKLALFKAKLFVANQKVDPKTISILPSKINGAANIDTYSCTTGFVDLKRLMVKTISRAINNGAICLNHINIGDFIKIDARIAGLMVLDPITGIDLKVNGLAVVDCRLPNSALQSEYSTYFAIFKKEDVPFSDNYIVRNDTFETLICLEDQNNYWIKARYRRSNTSMATDKVALENEINNSFYKQFGFKFDFAKAINSWSYVNFKPHDGKYSVVNAEGLISVFNSTQFKNINALKHESWSSIKNEIRRKTRRKNIPEPFELKAMAKLHFFTSSKDRSDFFDALKVRIVGLFYTDELLHRLMSFYGKNAGEIIQLWHQQDAKDIKGLIQAEFLYALQEEWVYSVEDFVQRRTNHALLNKEIIAELKPKLNKLLETAIQRGEACGQARDHRANETIL